MSVLLCVDALNYKTIYCFGRQSSNNQLYSKNVSFDIYRYKYTISDKIKILLIILFHFFM